MYRSASDNMTEDGVLFWLGAALTSHYVSILSCTDCASTHASLSSWVNSFPRARAANLRYRLDLRDADFTTTTPMLRQLHEISCAGCNQTGLTDAAFSGMTQLRFLDLRGWVHVDVEIATIIDPYVVVLLYDMEHDP